MSAPAVPLLPSPPRASSQAAPRGLRLAAFEVTWILLLFFLFAGSPPPDVGESHYLVKAKHYWQPAWCAGDLFVESLDAHGVFYWTFGWVTRWVSLPAAAWIGRVVTWGWLAWAWRRLSWALVPQPLVSLLSAGLWLLLLRNFHLAGEWVVGGVEAKGFAYPLVLHALESVVRRRWRAALLLAGAAGAFHVLVGGWTAVAVAAAWLVAGRRDVPLRVLWPGVLGGAALALPGLIPAVALNAGLPDEVAREAARIYAFERLSHHLVYHLFPPEYLWRFGALAAGWLALAWWLRREAGLFRLQCVVAATLALAAIGIAIDQGLVLWTNATGGDELAYELAAAPLLRYYWFRMSDALVPLGAALAVVAGLERLRLARPELASWWTAIAIALAAANLADVAYWRSRQRLPGAILQPRPTADSWPAWWTASGAAPVRGGLTAEAWYRDWRQVCAWIERQTPPDAKFLTPRAQQTFKWYAGRAEVVNWKDIPQDARGLVAWKQTFDQVHPRGLTHRLHDLAAFTDEQLIALAHEHGATHLVLDRRRAGREIRLPRVYPAGAEGNATFGVYLLPPRAAP